MGTSSDYFLRLGGTLAVAAVFVGAILNPQAGEEAARKASALAPARAPLAETACAAGPSLFTAGFAPIEDVLSISPLGGLTAPGEPLPAPYLRVTTVKGETAFDRRQTSVLAPGKADVVAIERRLERANDGIDRPVWSVYFRACEDVAFYYDRLDDIDPGLLRRAGGTAAFVELGGPEHIAARVQVRVRAGDPIGVSDGFDVGLEDARAAPAALVAPERYRPQPYGAAGLYDADAELIRAITTDPSRAKCPIDYLPADDAGAWSALLGDAWGMRRVKGDDKCRSVLLSKPGAAIGAWHTDASHNAATNKVSAISLGPDSIDERRHIFALHGRLKSLDADMVALNPMLEEERAAAARDFLTFEVGAGPWNAPFEDVVAGPVHCYDRLRANFVGPRINGVIFLQLEQDAAGVELLRIEARGDIMACDDAPTPWAFTGDETTFYR